MVIRNLQGKQSFLLLSNTSIISIKKHIGKSAERIINCFKIPQKRLSVASFSTTYNFKMTIP